MGKKNIYLCASCGHGFVSEDIDEGTTPFTTGCLNEKCNEIATSMFYGAPQELLSPISPALEWYKPKQNEIEDKPKSTKDHVKQGGLLSRLRKTVET